MVQGGVVQLEACQVINITAGKLYSVVPNGIWLWLGSDPNDDSIGFNGKYIHLNPEQSPVLVLQASPRMFSGMRHIKVVFLLPDGTLTVGANKEHFFTVPHSVFREVLPCQKP